MHLAFCFCSKELQASLEVQLQVCLLMLSLCLAVRSENNLSLHDFSESALKSQSVTYFCIEHSVVKKKISKLHQAALDITTSSHWFMFLLPRQVHLWTWPRVMTSVSMYLEEFLPFPELCAFPSATSSNGKTRERARRRWLMEWKWKPKVKAHLTVPETIQVLQKQYLMLMHHGVGLC